MFWFGGLLLCFYEESFDEITNNKFKVIDRLILVIVAKSLVLKS
jgi:hypothetical protein